MSERAIGDYWVSPVAVSHSAPAMPRQFNPKSKIQNPKSASGFTIVELLIAAFISLIVFGIGLTTINGTIRASSEATAMVRATENARLFFQTLERDLSGAWAGPFEMVKGKMDVPVDASGRATYTPLSAGTPIVLEFTQSGAIRGSALQFYTRADVRAQEAGAPPERRVLVRYYLNPNERTLCRQVNEDDGAVTSPPAAPLQLEGGGQDSAGKELWPVALSDPTQVDANAICEDVRTVRFVLRRWDDTLKQFVPPQPGVPPLGSTLQADQSDWPNCTHILVWLELQDKAAENRPFANLAIIPCRTFVKVLPIPKTIQ